MRRREGAYHALDYVGEVSVVFPYFMRHCFCVLLSLVLVQESERAGEVARTRPTTIAPKTSWRKRRMKLPPLMACEEPDLSSIPIVMVSCLEGRSERGGE
jgi:hypothetical protein